MSHKVKSLPPPEVITGDKYLNKLIRLEHTQASRKAGTGRPFSEKLSHVVKQPPPNVVQVPIPKKPRPPARLRSPVTTVIVGPNKEKEAQNREARESRKSLFRYRSSSRPRSEGHEKEPWGQLLKNNKSKENVSNFSNFDPLRTLHFLSKELHTKLEKISPDNREVIQMVADIQHALRRIPPEVSTFLHGPVDVSAPQSERNVSTKLCQTPPTLYQEDTEKFQKIMEENTIRLEASCKQLELVCTTLQNEKELTEKDLEEARENIDLLCKRVKELEHDLEVLSTEKIAQLEDENCRLQNEVDKAKLQGNSTNIEHYKKLIEELKKQKSVADESLARMEYDMTLLKMEKEKFVTMLGIRDREIKEIQEEMSRIQEQVNEQLIKLNTEVLHQAGSIKTSSEPYMRIQDNLFEIGDTTVSSVSTNATDSGLIKESPCGDCEGAKKDLQDEEHKLKATAVQLDLPTTEEKDSALDDLLAGLSPSLRCLLTSNNL